MWPLLTVPGSTRSPHDVSLDNPAYAALSGAHSRFAQRSGRALRYAADTAPLLALPSDASKNDWLDAIELLPPGTAAGMFNAGWQLPASVKVVRTFEAVQMVGDHAGGIPDPEAVTLSPADVPEMLELVRVTNPGPFLERTIELGEYVGIRRDGALVAMAGERLHFAGWTEISAVCTAPTHRGYGLASRLVSALVAGIQRRTEHPFLHVLTDNTNAIRVYERLGFRVRRSLTIPVVASAPAADRRM